MNRNPKIHATENDESYFVTLANDELLPKRERMASAIKKLGLEPIVPEGGYFMMASVKKLKKIHPTFEGEDSSRPWDVQCKLLPRFPRTDFVHSSVVHIRPSGSIGFDGRERGHLNSSWTIHFSVLRWLTRVHGNTMMV